MIEENKNNNNEIFDALPIPEDAVILKPKKVLDLSQLALLGIKEMIRQRPSQGAAKAQAKMGSEN